MAAPCGRKRARNLAAFDRLNELGPPLELKMLALAESEPNTAEQGLPSSCCPHHGGAEEKLVDSLPWEGPAPALHGLYSVDRCTLQVYLSDDEISSTWITDRCRLQGYMSEDTSSTWDNRKV